MLTKYPDLMSLFLSLIHADAAYTEEEEWSDEFDDDADEATLGLIPFVNINIKSFKTREAQTCNNKHLESSVV